MKEHEKQMYEEKVRFLINISHELRTPLTLIHAPLNRILKTLSPTDSNFVPLKSIYRQSQRMRDLLNMVLDLRKMEVGVSKLQIYPQRLNDWGNDLQTVLLLSSAFLCFFCIFGLASSDTVTVLTLSHLVPFLPFFEVIPGIFRHFAS